MEKKLDVVKLHDMYLRMVMTERSVDNCAVWYESFDNIALKSDDMSEIVFAQLLAEAALIRIDQLNKAFDERSYKINKEHKEAILEASLHREIKECEKRGITAIFLIREDIDNEEDTDEDTEVIEIYAPKTVDIKGIFKTRDEARDAGEKYYYDHRPCKRGHYSVKVVHSGGCYQCERLMASLGKKERKEKEKLKNKITKVYTGVFAEGNKRFVRPVSNVGKYRWNGRDVFIYDWNAFNKATDTKWNDHRLV